MWFSVFYFPFHVDNVSIELPESFAKSRIKLVFNAKLISSLHDGSNYRPLVSWLNQSLPYSECNSNSLFYFYSLQSLSFLFYIYLIILLSIIILIHNINRFSKVINLISTKLLKKNNLKLYLCFLKFKVFDLVLV